MTMSHHEVLALALFHQRYAALYHESIDFEHDIKNEYSVEILIRHQKQRDIHSHLAMHYLTIFLEMESFNNFIYERLTKQQLEEYQE
jgi:hypothetical protein